MDCESDEDNSDNVYEDGYSDGDYVYDGSNDNDDVDIEAEDFHTHDYPMNDDRNVSNVLENSMESREDLLKQYEEQDKFDTCFSAGLIAVILIVIGVPVWWHTTNIYRASLPYSQISKLSEIMPVRGMKVNLILPEIVLTSEKLNLAWLIEDRLRVADGNSLISTSVQVLAMKSDLRSYIDQVDNISKLDDYVWRDGVDVNFIVVPKERNRNLMKDASVHIGKHRSVFLSSSLDDVQMTNTVSTLLTDIINKYPSIRKIAMANSKHNKIEKPVKSLMREVKSKAAYDLVFSLINSDPLVPVTWNIQATIEAKLQPFLRKISGLANFTVESQVLYYAGFGVNVKHDGKLKRNYISDNQLPHVLNPLESRLGSQLSLNPILNFIVYIPPPSQTPLYIKYENRSSKAKYVRSFLSARWGGVVIYNPSHDATKSTNSSTTNRLKPYEVKLSSWVMPTFILQLRQLLGLEHLSSSKDYHTASYSDTHNIHDWEVDYLLHRHIVEHILTSASTLNSLSHLLEKISNIVISDDIANEVHEAVNSLHSAVSLLKDGRLVRAYEYAKRATVASEMAFYDPSLLELLYFPEDQKFAIYVPLFVPVGIPVLITLMKALKKLKKKKEE